MLHRPAARTAAIALAAPCKAFHCSSLGVEHKLRLDDMKPALANCTGRSVARKCTLRLGGPPPKWVERGNGMQETCQKWGPEKSPSPVKQKDQRRRRQCQKGRPQPPLWSWWPEDEGETTAPSPCLAVFGLVKCRTSYFLGQPTLMY